MPRRWIIPTGKLDRQFSLPTGPKRKHPAVAGNARGEVLMAWTEGTAWAKGGDLAWQLFGPDGEPIGEAGHAAGVPVWGIITAVALPNNQFALIY